MNVRCNSNFILKLFTCLFFFFTTLWPNSSVINYISINVLLFFILKKPAFSTSDGLSSAWIVVVIELIRLWVRLTTAHTFVLKLWNSLLQSKHSNTFRQRVTTYAWSRLLYALFVCMVLHLCESSCMNYVDLIVRMPYHICMVFHLCQMMCVFRRLDSVNALSHS